MHSFHPPLVCLGCPRGKPQPRQEYAGGTFFDGWDYYGHWDDLNNGNVIFVNKTNATNLAYVAPSGHAIITVDNTSVVPNDYPRNSVRITSQDYFELGTVFVVDAVHLPYGCSVWPSIWTKGDNWPHNGEIDIIEGVNLMTYNQRALHTDPGCSAAADTNQTGKAGPLDCSPTSGCTVQETTPNSYGAAFANNGGGVWAVQFDVSGIFIWFWQRANDPSLVTSTSATTALDISSWGPPSAAYPSGSSCNITKSFGAQQLVIDITLCGDWAGTQDTYAATCGNSTYNACYLTNVIGQGTYTDAHFELNYIRAFAASNAAVVNESAINSTTSASGGSSGAGGLAPSTSTSDAASGSPTGKTKINGTMASALTPKALVVVSGLLALARLLL
ncbi:glycoside hydrolase family 16 protein [Phanerochaete carnosa HHB-10118-sp]|uniref:Glycoside hydrolase family 16 protein n=1 Tax=Phanerochaete carnosa (strain HHB-10118-sp) TaxID=650164 RepID=K5W005_PHACS|nr:glycoside hydrolase family 16 protein [Phanerochaete carnosa HHB-10118-sp]EKM52410.1 glycoside hydrolase family 16 protein [Phanerochaete carnosa HHB-10118-sp]